MRCDTGPFKSNLVRQAIALTLNRPQLVNALFKGYADIGNDSPFAPVFPASSARRRFPSAPRTSSWPSSCSPRPATPGASARRCITEQRQEMPELAQFVKTWAKEIGVDINLTIEQPDKYYGSAVYGTSDWLDGEMSMVDYGARSTPNLFLNAPLMTYDKATGDRCLERGPLQQPRLRQARQGIRSLRPTFPASGPRQADRELLLWTRRRSSTPTSTTTWRDPEERDGRLPDGPQPVLPLERIEVLSSNLT